MASKSIAVLSACIILGPEKAHMNVKATTGSENNPVIEKNRQETRSGAALPVDKQPVMKEQPSEVLYKEGKPAIIECFTEGKEEGNKYFWQKDGKSFDLQQNHATMRKDEGSLVFLNPQASDEGQYQCFAETPAGIASSRVISFRKTYLIAAPVKSHEKTPVEGKPFQLDCVVPDAYPKPEIYWKKRLSGADPNADSTSFNRRITAGSDGNLYFETVTKDDVSDINIYVCVAKNAAVNEEVPLVEYVIKGVTKDTSGYNGELVPQYLSKDMMAKAGDTTMIYCMYGGDPHAYPKYSKDGKRVGEKSGDRVTAHNRTSGKRLLIQDTNEGDAGKYTCEVDNGKGAAQTHSMTLTVVSAPKYEVKPEKVVIVKTGQDVTIPCKVTGKPEPKVIWTHNAKPISGDRFEVSENGLVIKGVQKSDKGYYGCRAINEYGDEYVESLVQVN